MELSELKFYAPNIEKPGEEGDEEKENGENAAAEEEGEGGEDNAGLTPAEVCGLVSFFFFFSSGSLLIFPT